MKNEKFTPRFETFPRKKLPMRNFQITPLFLHFFILYPLKMKK